MFSNRYPRFLPLLALLAVAPCFAAEPTTQPAIPDSFMRFVDDNHGGGSLQTADVTFRNPAGVTVHLIAAVHIGEKSYYDGLNRDFKGYDAVLYELVNSKIRPHPPPATPKNPPIPSANSRSSSKNSSTSISSSTTLITLPPISFTPISIAKHSKKCRPTVANHSSRSCSISSSKP